MAATECTSGRTALRARGTPSYVSRCAPGKARALERLSHEIGIGRDVYLLPSPTEHTRGRHKLDFGRTPRLRADRRPPRRPCEDHLSCSTLSRPIAKTPSPGHAPPARRRRSACGRAPSHVRWRAPRGSPARRRERPTSGTAWGGAGHLALSARWAACARDVPLEDPPRAPLVLRPRPSRYDDGFPREVGYGRENQLTQQFPTSCSTHIPKTNS